MKIDGINKIKMECADNLMAKLSREMDWNKLEDDDLFTALRT